MSNQNIDIVLKAIDEASAVIKHVENQVNNLANAAQNTSKSTEASMGGISASIMSVGKVAAIAGAAFAGMAIKNAANFEQTSIAFNTMLGDGKQAQILLKQLSDFAKSTPFEFPEIATAGKQLLAFGVGADQIKSTLTTLGDIASGVGVPITQLTMVFGQVRAAGKLMGQDLNQFVSAGIPLIEMLAQNMGKGTGEIKKMTEQGKIGFEDVKKALETLTEEGGRFHGMMAKQSTSLSGLWSTLKDTFSNMANEIFGISVTGEVRIGSLFDKLKQGAVIALNALDKMTPYLIGFANGVQYIVGGAFKVLYTIVSNVIGAISTIVTAFGKNFENILKFVIAGAIGVATAALILNYKAILDVIKAEVIHIGMLMKQYAVTVYATVATAAQTAVNWLANTSYIALAKSIGMAALSALKMGAMFLGIAAIVALVVGLIYANWEKLKTWLAPVFEFIAKAGQMAPQLIADGWNGLVNVVAGAIKKILGATEKLAVFLKDKFSIDIGVQGIKDATSAVDQFANSVKFTADDVTGTFKSIAGGVTGAFKAVTGPEGLGNLLPKLEDVKGGMTSAGAGTKELGDKMKKLKEQAEDAIKPIIDKLKEGKKEIDDAKKAIKDKTEEWKKYRSEGVKALSDVNNEIVKLKKEASDINIKINTERDTSIAQRSVEVNKEIKEVTDDIAKAKKDISEENTPEKQKELIDLQTQLTNLEKERDFIRGNISDKAIKEAQAYSELSKAQQIAFDAEKQRADQLKENEQKMQSAIEKRMILEAQANQKNFSDLAIQTGMKDGMMTASLEIEKGKRVEIHDYENIALANDIAQKQLAYKTELDTLTSQLQSKLESQRAHIRETTALYKQFNDFLKDDTKKTATDMTNTLAQVNKALRETIALRNEAGFSSPGGGATSVPKRAFGGPVTAGEMYQVGERGAEYFVPSTNGNIIPAGQASQGVTINVNMGGVTVRNDQDIRTLTNMISEELARKMQLYKQGIA